MLRDLVIGQPPQPAVFAADDRPEMLKPGTAKRRILSKQEISPPKSLARNRPVGLRIDGKYDARGVARLGYSLSNHQSVPVGIGVHRSRAKCFPRQRNVIIIGVVVIQCRAPGTGMDTVGDGSAQIESETGHQSFRPLGTSGRLSCDGLTEQPIGRRLWPA